MQSSKNLIIKIPDDYPLQWMTRNNIRIERECDIFKETFGQLNETVLMDFYNNVLPLASWGKAGDSIHYSK